MVRSIWRTHPSCQHQRHIQARWHVIAASILTLLCALVLAPAASAQSLVNWTMYRGDNSRSGYNAAETAITPATAANLKLKWIHGSGGSVFSQPIVVNNVVYWGSFDGWEHATNLSNGFVWATFLGTTPACGAGAPGLFKSLLGTTTSSQVGVVSTAAVATVGGQSMLFVGGGNAHMYALNPVTGAVLWSNSLGSSPSHFIWSSPVVYNNSVYIGMASEGDCPLVQGQLIQLDAATGAVQHTFKVVPDGCIGAGVWGSPTIDAAAGTIYFATGNPGTCSTSEPYGESLVELNVSNLSFVHHWQVPTSQRVPDSDFGTTPTLFTATLNGTKTNMVGLANKNGIYYAFNRANINAGPVWRDHVSTQGTANTISSSAWDGANLYIGSSGTTIGGVACNGSLRKVNPATGAYIWQHCLGAGPVRGAVMASPGIAVVGQGSWIILVRTSDGASLFRFNDTGGGFFDGAPTIVNGWLFEGNMAGGLYAFSL